MYRIPPPDDAQLGSATLGRSQQPSPLAGSVASPHGLERVRAEVQLGAGRQNRAAKKVTVPIITIHNRNLDIRYSD